MIQLHDGDLLYHTSYLDISKIDLNKGKRGLDFGGGYNALGSHALKRRQAKRTLRGKHNSS